MKYVTSSTFAKVNALQGLDDEARTQVVDDAAALERFIAENEWLPDDELRKYSEQLGLDPDRTNAALAFLTETDRIVTIAPPDEQPADADEASQEG